MTNPLLYCSQTQGRGSHRAPACHLPLLLPIGATGWLPRLFRRLFLTSPIHQTSVDELVRLGCPAPDPAALPMDRDAFVAFALSGGISTDALLRFWS